MIGSLRSLLMTWVTLGLALCLQAMPLPDAWLIWRPDWLGLMLIYWCLVAPRRVGVFHGFVLGLLIDLVEGAPLGQNALVLSLLAYLSLLLYSRMRAYALIQQAVLVFVLLGIAQLVEQWLRTIFGPFAINLAFLLPALIGAVLWPWLFTLLQMLRRRLGVS
ncbi:rod shape-determining protein MreD [Modicisalibacter tunisiensis]|uniref:Rod shape-determining protein MreD n=1 Tax=Modicisalibacter tunisiensis TaxID=390637 RepID=A0ABS7X0Y8_9GAMM|nr:rod shape-determining protein MreD [Modicisalibacter tunisiensis]MBZ9538493.1 rod shape-determining protein MreD [Modicisalibacter tunisiensis]MBZ9568094.1 rod shape-determining protein MreD [Modicisalibacter tunisiensis]